jgi:hypothetical protein
MKTITKLIVSARARYAQKVKSLFGSSLLAYWPMWDASGTSATDQSGNGRNATYTACTLGQSGIGDGRTAVSLDGSTSYIAANIAGLYTAFSGLEGTLSLWIKVSGAGVYTDGANRRPIHFFADANNFVVVDKTTTNNELKLRYKSGGAAEKSFVISQSSTAWLHLGLTWSKTNDQVIGYFNGAQTGSTLTTVTSWVGAPSSMLIGAGTTIPSSCWSGLIAHVALANTPISAAAMAKLSSSR